MKRDLTYTIFTDFDATITREDIGDKLFREFGDYEACVRNYRKYRDGELDARECWRLNCATLKDMTPEAFSAYIDTIAVDGAFALFVEFCRSKEIPVTIVSDGFDAYISHVLEREGLSSIPFFSNSVKFHEGGFTPSFPYSDAECAA